MWIMTVVVTGIAIGSLGLSGMDVTYKAEFPVEKDCIELAQALTRLNVDRGYEVKSECVKK